MTQRDSSNNILFLTPHFRNSKFIAPHSLMFKTARATYGIPPLNATHSYVPSLYFVKGLNQNMIWYYSNCTHQISHMFQYSTIYYQWPLDRLQQIIFFLFPKHFSTTLQYLTHGISRSTSYFQGTPTFSSVLLVECLQSVRTLDQFPA